MSKYDYNFTARLLHQIALQKPVAEVSFDIENLSVKKKDKQFADNHVFVSGLARSGTTILLRYLYQTDVFKSLTYLDMPFVLMPNIWKKISYKKPSTEVKERAHQDGIMVGFDSPEAFEEVFWRVFCGDQYIGNDKLQLHEADDDILEKFKVYVTNILLSSNSPNQSRYLSKNNNNVLRFSSLQKAMPNAQIIIPFRDPLQQAFSLLTQHNHFCKKQSEDRFSLKYMNWLGHFEFGLNQRSFYLGDEEAFKKMLDYEKTDINFWLANWKNYYKYVNKQYTENRLFFNYDDFCRHPQLTMDKLFEKIRVTSSPIQLEPFKPSAKMVTGYNEELVAECNSIYRELDKKYQLWFNELTS
jgi:hypothetical protein